MKFYIGDGISLMASLIINELMCYISWHLIDVFYSTMDGRIT